jgi:hypothetical protein
MSRIASALSATIFLAAGIALVSAAGAAGDLDRAWRILAAKKFVDLTHSSRPRSWRTSTGPGQGCADRSEHGRR